MSETITVRDPLARLFTKAKIVTQLNVCTCTPLFRISEKAGRNALKFGLWLDTLAWRFTKVNGAGYRCMCARAQSLSYLRNGWTDCVETWRVVMGLPATRFTQDGNTCTNARVTARTFKHICSFLLVHRQKGVLLVIT